MAKEPRHLWLLGLSGSGKSTVGPRLARALLLPWVDTDTEIARDAGKTISEIFQTEGEEGFRQRECRILEKIAAAPAAVISSGGGVVIRDTNRKQMSSTGLRIYLKTDPATLVRRLRASQDRPLLAGDDRETTLGKLLAERAPWYEESDLVVDSTNLSPEEVVSVIQKELPTLWSR